MAKDVVVAKSGDSKRSSLVTKARRYAKELEAFTGRPARPENFPKILKEVEGFGEGVRSGLDIAREIVTGSGDDLFPETAEAVKLLAEHGTTMDGEVECAALAKIYEMNHHGFSDGEWSKALDLASRLVLLKKRTIDFSAYNKAREAMDESHIGLASAKEKLLENLAIHLVSGQETRPRPLLLVGGPGTGKTSLVRSFAAALGLPSALIQLSGMTGASFLIGDSKTYKGAGPGYLAAEVARCACLNPLLILDEVDKMGESDYNGRAAYALIDFLEREQSRHFTDNYVGVPFDASNVWVVLTANDLAGVPPVILDRVDIIRFAPYSEEEKAEIFRRNISRVNKIAGGKVKVEFDDAAVAGASSDPGASARSLETVAEGFFGKAARRYIEGGGPVLKVGADDLPPSPADVLTDLMEEVGSGVGIAPVLAVMNLGIGAVIPLEVKKVPGELGIEALTGHVDKMLVEAAMVAHEAARSAAEEIAGKRTDRVWINFPYPFGKGGDSAGLPVALAVLSVTLGRALPAGVAYTGAVSLNGAVLPVGGLAEKALAAAKSGYTRIFVPESQAEDLRVNPSVAKTGVEIVAAKSVAEVAKTVFALDSSASPRG